MYRMYLKAFVLIYFINNGFSLPEDYCLHPLNKKDCNVKPTPVFSYYKSGSRCEIEIWRGCPTFNMFPNEFVCSHHCIGKLWDREGDNEVELELPFEDECSVPINTSDCGIKGQFKYTFNGTLCTKVEWRGCYSQNVFNDEEACVSTCQQYDLKNELENLPTKDAEAINDILDRVIADDEESNRLKYHPQQQLMLKLKKKPEDKITITPASATEETPVENKSVTAETTKKTFETTSEAVAAITETVQVIETTIRATETTSEAVETTNEAVEATSELQTSTVIQTTVESTTEAVTTISSIEAAKTTTMGEGSAEEVILT